MPATRIPPIQCLLTFEALARLRSVTQASEELFVTPSAVSHRVKQLEQIIGTRLFGRADFSLTSEGSEYLAHVREGVADPATWKVDYTQYAPIGRLNSPDGYTRTTDRFTLRFPSEA